VTRSSARFARRGRGLLLVPRFWAIEKRGRRAAAWCRVDPRPPVGLRATSPGCWRYTPDVLVLPAHAVPAEVPRVQPAGRRGLSFRLCSQSHGFLGGDLAPADHRQAGQQEDSFVWGFPYGPWATLPLVLIGQGAG